MAQQIFDQYAPLAKVSANETIPVVAAIAQTRDGKDELLHGTVPFVPAGGLYVPVSAANRLPVEATLSGRKLTLVRNTYQIQQAGIGNNHIMVTSAPGTISYLMAILCNIPPVPGATTGIHRLYFMIDDVSSPGRLLGLEASHNQPILVTRYGIWGSQVQIIEGDLARYLDGLANRGYVYGPQSSQQIIIRYQNNTDAPRTDTITFTVWALQEAVV